MKRSCLSVTTKVWRSDGYNCDCQLVCLHFTVFHLTDIRHVSDTKPVIVSANYNKRLYYVQPVALNSNSLGNTIRCYAEVHCVTITP